MPLTAPGSASAQPYGPIEPPRRPGWLQTGRRRGGPFPFTADPGGIPVPPPAPPAPAPGPVPEPLPAVFAPLLADRLEPWMNADLALYVQAFGAIFDGVAQLVYPVGHDGDPDFTNLAVNPSFEHDQPLAVPYGWANNGVLGGTFRVETGWAQAGSQSCRCAGTADSPGWVQTLLMPVIPGGQYSWQATVNVLTVSGSVTGRVNWISGDGSTVLSSSTGQAVATTGVVTLSESALTAPASAAWAQVQVFTASVPFDGYLDAVYFGPGALLPDAYFDGDTANAGWNGRAGLTSSFKPGFVPSWGRLFDVRLCPTFALPYLAQLVGVKIPAGVSDADARALIRAEAGFKRGTPASIGAALERALVVPSGTDPTTLYSIVERTAADGTVDGYHFLVDVDPSAVSPAGNFTAVAAAIDSVKPVGVRYDIVSLVSPPWSQYSRAFSAITATMQNATLADVT